MKTETDRNVSEDEITYGAIMGANLGVVSSHVLKARLWRVVVKKTIDNNLDEG